MVNNFAATLSESARNTPNGLALIEPSRLWTGRFRWRYVTFGALETLVDRYAAGLRNRGVRRGDRVLYLLRPSTDGFAVFYALLRLGAVPIFIDPMMGLSRLRSSIREAKPAVIIGVPQVHLLRVFARDSIDTVRVLITSGWGSLLGGARLSACRGASDTPAASITTSDEDCYLPFTSGSTGPPKAVHCSHAMVHAQSQLVADACGWQPGERVVMCYAPFVPFALADGLTVILPAIDFARPAAAAPHRIVQAIVEHDAQCAFASPIVWMRLARYCHRERRSLPTLQRAIAAGAPIQADLHRRLLTIIHPNGHLCTPYGATEAMPLTTINTSSLIETWDQVRSGDGTCLGPPLRGVEIEVIRVTDEPIPRWTNDLPVARGAIGELVVGGSVVSPKYLDPRHTTLAKIERNGQVLHRTGDLVWMDPANRIWFCGRKSHRIDTPSGMVAPVPLENVLNEHPDVFRSAVVGVGARGKQRVIACVELENGKQLSTTLRSELVDLIDATRHRGIIQGFLRHRGFPVDARHNSKIDRNALAEWASRRLATSTAPNPI